MRPKVTCKVTRGKLMKMLEINEKALKSVNMFEINEKQRKCMNVT